MFLDTRLLTLQEASELGFGAYSTLRRHIKQGRLPACKVGGRVKVRRCDLEAFAKPIEPFNDVELAVKSLVASAPPLNDEQIHHLATIFGGSND